MSFNYIAQNEKAYHFLWSYFVSFLDCWGILLHFQSNVLQDSEWNDQKLWIGLGEEDEIPLSGLRL